MLFLKNYDILFLPEGIPKELVMTTKNDIPQGMETNLKKAVTEMVALSLLSGEDMYAQQLMSALEERSGGALSIVFPYAALYRLIDSGYICEAYKKIAPDGRRRQYYQITDAGRGYLTELTAVYRRVIGGVDRILAGGDAHD